jgi:hypothetical protein
MADTQTNTSIATVTPDKQLNIDAPLQHIFDYLSQ